MAVNVRTVCALALVLSLSLFLSGCAAVHYRGDGVLTRAKAPAWFCADQYDVDFGPVDFSVPTAMRFQIAGLPLEEYAAGFDVVASDAAGTSIRSTRDDRRPDPLVELRLENERGEAVLHQRGRLSEWVWSGSLAAPKAAFVYGRGKSAEVRLNATAVENRREGVRADAGWGTYFTPRRNGRYTLLLKVEEAEVSGGSYTTTLHVRGVVGCL